jgi:anti-anti-sigma factor
MLIKRTELSPREVELSVHADLVAETTQEFRNALYAELDQPHHLLRLDLEHVRIMSSSALGAMLLFEKKAGEMGKKLLITKCNNELRSMLMAIRLDRIIDMEDSSHTTH